MGTYSLGENEIINHCRGPERRNHINKYMTVSRGGRDALRIVSILGMWKSRQISHTINKTRIVNRHAGGSAEQPDGSEE